MATSTNPMPIQPITPTTATTAMTATADPQSTEQLRAACHGEPQAPSAFPARNVAEGVATHQAQLERYKEAEAMRRLRLLGEQVSPAALRATEGAGTPRHHDARDVQRLKARARATQVPFRTLRAWSVAFHVRGLAGLEPNDWKALPPAEALATAHQRLQRLGALAEAETITLEDLTTHAATVGWQPQRLRRWLQRYRIGGLLAVLGPGMRDASPAPFHDHDHDHEQKAQHQSTDRSGRARPRPRDLGALAEHELEEALQRRARLGTLVEQPHASRTDVAACALANGVMPSTIWRELQRYHAFGLAGLARQVRSDRDQYHNLDASVADLVRAIALTRPAWTARAIADFVCARANERGLAGPSIDQVRVISRHIPEALRQIAAGDYTAFNNTSLLTYPILHPANEIDFQIDHRYPLPMELRDDRPAQVRSASGVVRPYLTQVIDAASRGVPAGEFSFAAPTRFTVTATIRDALLPSERNVFGGRPDEIWVDNGRELIARLVHELCREMGIRLWAGPAHAPRIRGIVERFHQTLDTRLWSTLPGYTGADAGAGSRAHQTPHTRRTPPREQLLTLRDLEERYWAFIAVYNTEPHSELDGQTPLEYWRQHSFASPVDPRVLDPLLQEGITRTIHKQGIKLRGRLYFHTDLYDPTLVNRDIDSVVVRVAPGDVVPDEIEVYAGGHWLCTAVAVTSPKGRLVTREEIAEAQRRQRRGLQAHVKHAHRVVDAVAGGASRHGVDGSAHAPDAATREQHREPGRHRRGARGRQGHLGKQDRQISRGASGPPCTTSLPALPDTPPQTRAHSRAALHWSMGEGTAGSTSSKIMLPMRSAGATPILPTPPTPRTTPISSRPRLPDLPYRPRRDHPLYEVDAADGRDG